MPSLKAKVFLALPISFGKSLVKRIMNETKEKFSSVKVKIKVQKEIQILERWDKSTPQNRLFN